MSSVVRFTITKDRKVHPMRFSTAMITCFVLLLSIGVAQAQNLVVNGDFEAGNIGFTSEFVYSPGDISDGHTYDVVADPFLSHYMAVSFYDHTSGDASGLMLAVNGRYESSQPNIVWEQTVSVVSNRLYNLSFWTSEWYNGPAQLAVAVNGQAVSEPFEASTVTGEWQEFTGQWSSNDSLTATITIRSNTVIVTGNDFVIDDIIFSADLTVAADELSWGNVKALYR